MPEALAVFLVLVVCVAIYLAAKFSASRSRPSPEAQKELWSQELLAVEEKLRKARAENWGEELLAPLEAKRLHLKRLTSAGQGNS